MKKNQIELNYVKLKNIKLDDMQRYYYQIMEINGCQGLRMMELNYGEYYVIDRMKFDLSYYFKYMTVNLEG